MLAGYNFLFSFLSGFQIYLASSIENIGKELLEVNPTIFCAVPLIYKKIFIAAGDNDFGIFQFDWCVFVF